MSETSKAVTEKPSLSPRMAALSAEINRRKSDIATLVQMALEVRQSSIEVEMEPPAHLKNVPGEATWSQAELGVVQNAVRARYEKLGVTIVITQVPVDPDRQIAMLLADDDPETPLSVSFEPNQASTQPVIEAVVDTAPELPTYPPVQPGKLPKKPATPPPGDSSAAARDLLLKMGIGVPKKRRPT